MKNYLCANRALPLGARIAMGVGIGTALMVSIDLATGIAIAGGLFAALAPRGQQN